MEKYYEKRKKEEKENVKNDSTLFWICFIGFLFLIGSFSNF